MGDHCLNCGCPKSSHRCSTLAPFSNTACEYSHDSDNPCWCYAYVGPEAETPPPGGTKP